MGHFAKDCRSKKKGNFKGKHHASAAAGDEEPRKKTRESSSHQDKRKEYYLVLTLFLSLSNSVDTWLVESGASRHITAIRVFFHISETRASQYKWSLVMMQAMQSKEQAQSPFNLILG